MIAAVTHKNRNSSRTPTWPEVAECRNYQCFLKLYLSLLLLVICSQYHHEHYRASTTHQAGEVWRCYINVITRTCSGFTDISALSLGRCTAFGVMRIYQSNPSRPCYNILIYIYIYYIYTYILYIYIIYS